MAHHVESGWWEGIERDVAWAMCEEVSNKLPGILSVDVDLINGDVQIIRNDSVESASKAEIVSLAKEAAARLKLNDQLWGYRVCRKPAAPFVSHITYQPLRRRFGRSPSKLSRFDISLNEMYSLRGAVTELIACCANVDFVASFAAGGVSILEHAAERWWSWQIPIHPLSYNQELRI